MTPTPLDKISLRWHDHKAALWWLCLLYKQPDSFWKNIKDLPATKQNAFVAMLALNFFPYSILICIFGRAIIFNLIQPRSIVTVFNTNSELLMRHGLGMVFGVFAAFAVGMFYVYRKDIPFGLAFGIVLGNILGMTVIFDGKPSFGVSFGIPQGLLVGSFTGVALRAHLKSQVATPGVGMFARRRVMRWIIAK